MAMSLRFIEEHAEKIANFFVFKFSFEDLLYVFVRDFIHEYLK